MVWNDPLVAQADSVPDLYSRDGKSCGGGGGGGVRPNFKMRSPWRNDWF